VKVPRAAYGDEQLDGVLIFSHHAKGIGTLVMPDVLRVKMAAFQRKGGNDLVSPIGDQIVLFPLGDFLAFHINLLTKSQKRTTYCYGKQR
jgi:hypothetical protein